MVKTGYISFLVVTTAGGYDADRNPIAAVSSYSENVPCNLATVKKEYITLVDQQKQQASFSTYIDNDKLSALDPQIDIPSVTSVKLFDNNLNELGIYQVQNVEYLNLTKRTKLIV